MNDQINMRTYDFSYLASDPAASLARRLDRSEYVSGEDLAIFVEEHGEKPIPPTIRNHLCQILRGKIGKPNGRPALHPILRNFRDMVVAGQYHRHRRMLSCIERQANKRSITKLSTVGMTLAERAARLVAARYLDGEESWRQVQNIASSRKHH